MTQEILFRGISKDRKKWVEGNLIDDAIKENKSYFILPSYAGCYGEYEEIIPATIGQYTTKDDDESDRLFVGDKINVEEMPSRPLMQCYEAEIVFVDGMFGFYMPDKTFQSVAIFNYSSPNGYRAFTCLRVKTIHDHLLEEGL